MAQHYTKDTPLRVFEAFAGIGTQRMALNNLNIPHEVVAISEIDEYAIKSYEAIHGSVNNLGDISVLATQDIPDHDLFTYSFPCQSLSTYGLRGGLERGTGTTSSLLWDCERVIKHKRPRYLLMENVKALVNKANLSYFNEWLTLLEGYGYHTYYQVINARDFGVPQNRERVFALSILDDDTPYQFPEPTPLITSFSQYLDSQVDGKYYLSEERVQKVLTNKDYRSRRAFGEEPIYLKGTSHIEILGTVYYTASERFQQTIYGQGSRTVKAGNNDLSVVLLNHQDQTVSIRRLTPLECFRLMGVSDEDFYKAQEVCSNTQLYKQAGNAIVVKVLDALFSQLNLVTE